MSKKKVTQRTGTTAGKSLTADRRLQQFQVRGDADSAFIESCRVMRLSKIDAMSALFLWFAKQELAVQQLVTGTLPPQYADDAAARVREWAKANYRGYISEVAGLRD